MRKLKPNRYALSICVAAIVSACSANQSTAPQLNAGAPSVNLLQQAIEPAQPLMRGGVFSGGYSGTSTYTACNFANKENGSLTFHGTGKVSFLGRSTESGGVTLWYRNECLGSWVGSALLTSSENPKNQINVELKMAGGSQPCTTYDYTVIAGYGKFVKATGSGTLTMMSCTPSYKDQWSGTLYY